MRKVYLLSTEHLEDSLWFRDIEDFKVAMSYIAFEALHHPKGFILAFILMSNHVHFILKGRKAEVVGFINRFKRRYSIYYRRKYGIKEFLRDNELDVKEIPYNDEAVERAIAYVLMNCAAAGICTHPSQYPWGTGGIYFCPEQGKGMRVKDISGRALMRLMHTGSKELPEDWPISPDGYILPSAYVDIKAVESILSALPDLCMSLFQKKSFQQLTADEQSEFARQIRFRFSADATQIARVCGVSYADAARLLDSYVS